MNDADYTLNMEVKDVGEDGTFSGIASIYGVEDLTGDVIDKGAFTKTLAESGTVPVLWQHQSANVVGSGEVKEWQNKILINGVLDMDDPAAKFAQGKMKRKLVTGLSIGFNTVKSTWEEIEGRMVRHITELKLWEVSLVTFPALPGAQITRVKNMQDLEPRVKQLEAQISALSAAKATPVTEPAKVEEPPVQQSNEPAAGHSELIQNLKETFQWNQSNNS